jgi:hypothetical protein
MARYSFSITPKRYSKNRILISRKESGLILQKAMGIDFDPRKKKLTDFQKGKLSKIREKREYPQYYLKIGKDVISTPERSDGRIEIPKNIVEKYKIRHDQPIRLKVYIPDEFEFGVGNLTRVNWEYAEKKGLMRVITFSQAQSSDNYFETKEGKYIHQREILLQIVKDYIIETVKYFRKVKMYWTYSRINFKVHKEQTGEDLNMTMSQENVEIIDRNKWRTNLGILLKDLEADFWNAFAKEETEEYTEVWLERLEIAGYILML